MMEKPGTLRVAPQSQRDVVARIAAGDRAAESEFVAAYEHGVRVLLRRRCRPGDPIVDDLVQEVLSSVLQRLRLGAICDAAALPAYVQTTVAHASTAEYRRRRKTEPLDLAEAIPGAAEPPERISNDELARVLRSVMAEMSVARDRQLLLRFYLDERSKDEVCRELGIDPGHFHRVVFRARNRFRELLELRGIGASQ